ncbi:hypothetical protein DA391_14100 [Yersinia massiliensis]|uniref:Host cell division inhibitor Icd-like protein n=2 Tax=Yersinia massiliensis TaxID=419257 RepID=A0ABM6UUH2_9GAMM|nr:hypothetical protein DA391_14100 [Yersinia massiliensis]
MMPITQAATLNRLSLSESDTNPVISGQLQKILQVTFGYLLTAPAISVLFKGGNSNAQNLNCETFGGTSKSNLHQSSEFNGDCYSAKYSAQQAPLKNGNSPSLPVRRNLLIKLNCAETGQLANSLILSKNAQSVCREIKGEQYSGSAEHYRYAGSVVIRNGCNNENQQVTGKEKGSAENTTLEMVPFLIHEENQRSPVLDCKINHDSSNLSYEVNQQPPTLDDGTNQHIRTCEIFVGHRVTVSKPIQPSGASLAFLRLRRLISPCKAATTNCEVLSPSSFTNSTSSITSCGTLACIFCDLALTLPVAITESSIIWWNTVYTKNKLIKWLKWNTVDAYSVFHLGALDAQEITKPGSALTLTGPLTTNDSLNIEAAMLNHTPTRFKFLFLAVHRSDLSAKPHRESVTAHSEQDARRSLAGQFVLSFAGRIPAQGVCNA